MMFPAHPARSDAARPVLRPGARGFTLLELLITVTIVGIVSAIGMPMLSNFVEDAGVSTQTDLVLDSLMFTRSEAVKRNARVTMCRSTDGATCAAAAVIGDWRMGWIVFTDDGTTGTVDGTDRVLRVQSKFSGKGEASGTGGVSNFVSYGSTGQTRLADGGPQSGTFSLCGRSDRTKRRKIALTPGTGWVGTKIVAPSAICTDA